MAKSGVVEGDRTASAAKATELKKQVLKLVKSIADDDDDVNLDAIDRAEKTLRALRELKLKRCVGPKACDSRCGSDTAEGAVPADFKCPLSFELMRDPVIIASGQTFDRPFIHKWLKAGNRTCPRTQQVLSHTILTPNHLIRGMIAQWCKNHGIKLPDSVGYTNNEGSTQLDRIQFISLLKKISSTSRLDKKEAAKELRLLTKRTPSFRALFGETLGAIPQLLSPLSETKSHPDLQEDLITTLLNLSIHDSNKKLVAETPMVIPLLMEALRSGTIETRSNAAATLFTLSALGSNKALIGKSGALKPLIDLLDEGHPSAMKDVAPAIFNLCIMLENKATAIRNGAVPVILKKLESRVHVDELLSILAMLSTSKKAIEEMGEIGAVPCLLCIMRESSCSRNKENCAAILYNVCCRDRSKLKEIKEEENTFHTISQLAEDGTSRAKRKAFGILERMNRGTNPA